MPRTLTYLNRLKERQIASAKKNGRTLCESDFVFSNEKGIPIKSFRKSFLGLLDAAGLTIDNQGKKRCIYSLRHTYATFREVYGNVEVHELAQNMGTSVQMIEKHYGHMKPEQVAERLTREK